jgi:hypothetical protein
MCIYECMYKILYYYVILYYYIYTCHIHGRGGGDMGRVMGVTGAHTASGINRQMPYYLINSFLTVSWGSPVGRTFGVLKLLSKFGEERMNFNQWTVKMNQTEENSWFLIHKTNSEIFSSKSARPLVVSPVGIRVNNTGTEHAGWVHKILQRGVLYCEFSFSTSYW